MIYTAVLIACLQVAPEPVGCRTHEMLIMAGANPTTAALEAQTRAAAWLAERPALTKLSLTVRAGRGL